MKQRLIQFCLIALAIGQLRAQPGPGAGAPPPHPPLPTSPVATFRMLLATNEAGRTQWIAKWKPSQRELIEGKIAEFQRLPPPDREARLQTLQLRHYLPLLMRMPPAEWPGRIAFLPPGDQLLISNKLRTWIILPPPLRQDLLAHQQAISVFLFSGTGTAASNALQGLPPARQQELQRQFQSLNELPPERRAQTLAHFERFFELAPTEQARAMKRLKEAELAQMQQTVKTFTILPPPLQQQALLGFKKLADMPAADRAAFLQTAERWQKMTEAERERWRKMVAQMRAAKAIAPPHPGQRPPVLAGQIK